MASRTRTWALAAGAAALVSSQAAYAAPAKTAPRIDPLVSLSLLGSAQSRAALCSSGACAVPARANAASAAASPAIAGAAASAAALQYRDDDRRIGLDLPGLIVLFTLPVALVLAFALEDDGPEPVPNPISPG